MPIEIKQTVGTGINVTISADKQKEAVEAAAFFGDLPSKCGKCGCSDLTFTVRRPETYVYYGLKCKGCFAEFSFGQYKDQSGLFAKFAEGWKTWEERKAEMNNGGAQGAGGYQDPRAQQGGRQQTGTRSQTGGGGRPRPPADGDDDNIPF